MAGRAGVTSPPDDREEDEEPEAARPGSAGPRTSGHDALRAEGGPRRRHEVSLPWSAPTSRFPGLTSHRPSATPGCASAALREPPFPRPQRAAIPASRSSAGQASRTLGYFGAQPLASRNLRLEMRSERASVSPTPPISRPTHFGRNFGGGTPSASASEPKNSRRRTGSSSTTL